MYVQYLLSFSARLFLASTLGWPVRVFQPDWICLLLQRDRDARRAWQLLKAVQTSGWGGSASKPKPVKGQLQNPEKVRDYYYSSAGFFFYTNHPDYRAYPTYKVW